VIYQGDQAKNAGRPEQDVHADGKKRARNCLGTPLAIDVYSAEDVSFAYDFTLSTTCQLRYHLRQNGGGGGLRPAPAKSTLAHASFLMPLLRRTERPPQQHHHYKGQDIKQGHHWRARDCHRHRAWDAVLFNGTVEYNIAYGKYATLGSCETARAAA
jgi:hypothetical protein